MILEKLHTSFDLHKLDNSQLEVLATEIRQFLVENVSKTGGHLAANLGVVELTLALHRVFDINSDKIIWDVGHQSYTHKILTGRGKSFDRLRQFNGLSGFPKTQENQADIFNTGHSSTSISAAAGFATVTKLKGENSTAVAVIGDGALSGGMAFEALNHAGTMDIPLVVILNDNGMSISRNVGGISQRLERIRSTGKYIDLKTNVKSTIDRIPIIGQPLKKGVQNAKKSIRRLVVENIIFEEFGFTYLGPIDGHDINSLEIILKQAKALREPVLVHVHTKKGKGYIPAEKKPEAFHGISGSVSKKKSENSKGESWSECFGKTLCALAEKNKKITAITAAMPEGTGLLEFKKRFPERFFDVGIAEQHAVTFAAGLAKAGYTPCFAVYSTFLQRGYDQLLHDVALQNLHAVFCLDRSGPVGRDGETHQGVFDISYLSHLPGFTILSPSDKADFERMLDYAINICDGPVAIRYPRGKIPQDTWGKSRRTSISPCLRKSGEDVLIISTGAVLKDAMEAAEILEENGVSVGVLDIGAIKPLDRDALMDFCKNKRKIATLEDNVITGGLGQQISCITGRAVKIFAYPDEPIVQGSVEEIKIKYGLSPEQIAKALMN